MNGAPSVSVVLVTRDRRALLADALAGVVAQVKAPCEVRIGDDGTTPAVLPDDLPLLEVTVVPGGHGCAAAARNAAAAGARGDVLAFLDDDDRWLPDHLVGLAEAFRDPAVGFAWRDSVVVREHVTPAGERIAHDHRTLARDWDDALMRSDDYLPPSAWGVRRSCFEALGGFDPTLRYSEDWDFVLRAAAHTGVRRVPGVTVEVRLRESGNTSAEFTPERLDCLRRVAERHGFAIPGPKTFWEVALAVGSA